MCRSEERYKPLGDDLLSQAVSHQVSSALSSLTSGFGMGPGVPSTHKSPREFIDFRADDCQPTTESRLATVTVNLQFLRTTSNGLSPRPIRTPSLTPCSAYMRCLYSRWSTCGLTGLCHGGSNLGTSFPLRCIQRLSRPNVATGQCRWHDNPRTRGSSTPVLSY